MGIFAEFRKDAEKVKKKGKRKITAKQRAAREKNMAVARAARVKKKGKVKKMSFTRANVRRSLH